MWAVQRLSVCLGRGSELGGRIRKEGDVSVGVHTASRSV
jgi:hypothetical protein